MKVVLPQAKKITIQFYFASDVTFLFKILLKLKKLFGLNRLALGKVTT